MVPRQACHQRRTFSFRNLPGRRGQPDRALCPALSATAHGEETGNTGTLDGHGRRAQGQPGQLAPRAVAVSSHPLLLQALLREADVPFQHGAPLSVHAAHCLDARRRLSDMPPTRQTPRAISWCAKIARLRCPSCRRPLTCAAQTGISRLSFAPGTPVPTSTYLSWAIFKVPAI
jgi:hypothetical protein